MGGKGGREGRKEQREGRGRKEGRKGGNEGKEGNEGKGGKGGSRGGAEPLQASGRRPSIIRTFLLSRLLSNEPKSNVSKSLFSSSALFSRPATLRTKSLLIRLLLSRDANGHRSGPGVSSGQERHPSSSIRGTPERFYYEKSRFFKLPFEAAAAINHPEWERTGADRSGAERTGASSRWSPLLLLYQL